MRPRLVMGRVSGHVVMPAPHCGAERQNPLGCFTDVAQGASFGSPSLRYVFEWAFKRWPRCRGPTNMRRAFDSSTFLYQKVALDRAAVSLRHSR